jgi:hypothetical protein
MMAYLKTWLALKADRRAVTTLDYGVMAGVMALAVITDVAERLLSAL